MRQVAVRREEDVVLEAIRALAHADIDAVVEAAKVTAA